MGNYSEISKVMGIKFNVLQQGEVDTVKKFTVFFKVFRKGGF